MSSLNAPYASGDSGATFLTEINADLAALNTDKAEIAGQAFSGKVEFTGTDHAGLQAISLTTTERDALTPVNGDLIYNETDSKFQMYQGSAWVDVTSVAADASTTVKGIVEMATDAEVEAGTGTGGTGAQLVVGADSTHVVTDNEKAAVAGTSGTPSGSNKFVTNDDTAEAATASKVVRADSSNKIKEGYLNITDANATTLTDGSNADALHVHAGNRIYTDSTTHTFTDTTAENVLLTTTIPANTLGTENILKFRVWLSDFNTNNVSAGTFVRISYGATAIATASLTATITAAGGASMAGYIEGEVLASGATGTQIGSIKYFSAENSYSSSGLNADSIYMAAVGTATEDSTGALTLKVTASIAEANADMESIFGYVEIIKA